MRERRDKVNYYLDLAEKGLLLEFEDFDYLSSEKLRSSDRQ